VGKGRKNIGRIEKRGGKGFKKNQKKCGKKAGRGLKEVGGSSEG